MASIVMTPEGLETRTIYYEKHNNTNTYKYVKPFTAFTRERQRDREREREREYRFFHDF
jgi:hypothetical protein